MAHFDKEFLLFLAELEVNNNREWFNANKDRFKSKVEEPFIRYMEHLIPLARKQGAMIRGTGKDCVFRIYRDVRFSKDKSPYKLHMAAFLGHEGKKDFEHPGFYLEFTADRLRVYSGLYQPGKILLEKVRQKIARKPDEFRKTYSHTAFRKTFGTILGEKARRVDAKWRKAAEKEPHLYNKSFYCMCETDSETLLGKGPDQWILSAVKAARDMNDFLYFR